jgi:uncharacterized BrkB/YihY/UPF0761 family membrane protein
MEISRIYILIIAVIASIFSIASTSIGIQSFNKNKQWKDDHTSNYGFLVVSLIVSILILLLSFVGLYFYFKTKLLF